MDKIATFTPASLKNNCVVSSKSLMVVGGLGLILRNLLIFQNTGYNFVDIDQTSYQQPRRFCHKTKTCKMILTGLSAIRADKI